MELNHSVFHFLVLVCVSIVSSIANAQDVGHPCYNLTDRVQIVPPGTVGANVNWPPPPRNPDEYSLYRSKAPGAYFALGETVVTYAFVYSASDRGTELCSFTVTVRESNCPNGEQEVSCANPCQTSDCPAFPEAQCNPNYCGGCFAEFFDTEGNKLDCTVVPVDTPPVVTRCPNNTAVTATPGQTTGIATWSEPVVEDDFGVPVVNRTHSSGSTFPLGVTIVRYTFTDGVGNTANCIFNVTVFTGQDTTPPEIKDCPDDIHQPVPSGQTFALVKWQEPTATDDRDGIMTPKYRTLNATSLFIQAGAAPIRIEYIFEDKAGNKAVCTFTVAASSGEFCPDGSQPVTCITNPCDNRECPAFPEAQCRPNYCGGCNAEFYDARNIRVNCTKTDLCPDGSQPVNCITNPCDVNDCPALPDAQCRPNYCGGCNAEFYDTRGIRVNCTQTELCPDGSQPVNCITNPCDVNDCPAFPDAQCRPNYCGGCNAEFYDARGIRVNCTQTGACRDGSVPVTCVINPCNGSSCAAFPDAECIPNYCGGCFAEFYGSDGSRLECNNTGGSCPDGSQPVPCATDPCLISNCPANPQAQCRPNYCGGCNAEFYDAAGGRVDCRDTDGEDRTPPIITNCPANMQVPVPEGHSFVEARWTEPTATDDSQQVTLQFKSFSDPFVYLSVGGSYTVEYVFEDGAGNMAICSFTVTGVEAGSEDTTPPVVQFCPADITRTLDPGQTGDVVTWPLPVAEDESQTEPSLVSSHTSGSFFPAGVTTVDNTFTDAAGNIAICTFSINLIQDVDECSSNPCVFGNCVDGDNYYTCDCYPGYSGTNCETTDTAPPGDTTPPVLDSGCPADISTTADPGQTTASVTWTEPTATDESGGVVTVSSSHSPGYFFPIGVTSVLYTFTDPSGNTLTCSFSVQVSEGGGVDITPPEISGCPDNIQHSVPEGFLFELITWEEPTAEDQESGPVTLQYKSLPNPSIFVEVGKPPREVKYVFEDRAGNVATCSFTVSAVTVGVEDTIPPVINGCPEDLTVTAEPGQSTVEVNWVEPTATDDSGYTPSVRSSHSPGSDFAVSPLTTVVTYTFSDSAGNVARCEFTVTIIVDTTPPVIENCPRDITLTGNPEQSGAIAAWEPPTATDDSGETPELLQTHVPGLFPLGITRVQYLFTDSAGNVASCSFNVIVTEGTGIDTTPPVISGCPGDIQQPIPPGHFFALATWKEPTAYDGVSGHLSPSFKNLPAPSIYISSDGSYSVVYTFEDDAGNEASCSFTVTGTSGPLDTTPPEVTSCPQDIFGTVSQGQTEIIVTWTEPSATDNSGNEPSRTASHNSGSSFPIGSTAVIYTFTDSMGNIATCIFNVIISEETGEDTTPPVISGCPDNIQHSIPPGLIFSLATWEEPTAYDAVSGVVEPYFRTLGSPRLFVQATGQPFTIEYKFADAAGNEAVCSFTVTGISGPVDTSPPVVTSCPQDIVRTVSQGQTELSVTWTEPSATDDSGNEPTRTASHNSGSSFPVGSTEVTYTFTDSAGNRAECTFIVVVVVSAGPTDTTPPVVSNCPNDFTITASPGQNVAVGTWVEPTATDDSSTAPDVSRSHAPGFSFPIGTTVVTYVFSDPSENIASCVFSVVVVSEGTGEDTTPPVISGCPGNIQHPILPGLTFDLVTWEEPTANDAVSGVVEPYFRTLGSPRLFVQATGQPFTVEYKFADAAGNEAVCSFTVTGISGPVDTTPPEITSCPQDIFRTVSQGQTGITVTWTEPSATDDSGNEPTRTASHNSGVSFPVGSTEVTYTFSDSAGNRAACTFTVVVSAGPIDTTPPVVTSCPSHIEVTIAQGQTTGTATWTEPSAVDDSGVPTVTSTHNSGFAFPLGTTTVRYTFEDGAGNNVDCIFTVTVNIDTGVDTTPPQIENCPNDIREPISPGQLFTQVEWQEPTARDENEDTVVTLRYKSLASPSLFVQVGADPIEVQYIFEDEAGNEAICSFTVAAGVDTADSTPPVVSNCPNDIAISASQGQTSGTATWDEPTAEDDSTASPSVSRSHPSGSSFPFGTTVVTYVFSDPSGNVARCVFHVNVSLPTTVIPPEFTCSLQDITQTIPQGSGVSAVSWTEPALPSMVILLVQTRKPGDFFPVGVTDVMYQYLNEVTGERITCSFRVTVTEADSEPNVNITCPNNINMPARPDQNFVQVEWKEPSGTIQGNDVNIVYRSHSVNTMIVKVGDAPVTVKYELSDGNGHLVDCEFNITTMVDTLPPVVSQCPGDIPVSIPPGTTSGEATWTPPMATDNSGLSVTLTSNYAPNSVFPLGTTLVRYTAIDAVGNIDQSCSFNVIVSTGGGSSLCNPSPCSDLELCYYTTTQYVCISNSDISNGRKRRDLTGACNPDSCGPHSSCLAVNNDNFICLCEEGWQDPYCYTAAADDDQSKTDLDTTPNWFFSLANESFILIVVAVIVLLLVIMTLTAVTCFLSHRFTSRQNQSLSKQALLYNDYNNVKVPPQV